MHLTYINYEIAKRNYELNVRLKDQSFEQIVAAAGWWHAGPGPVGQRRDPDDELAEFPGGLIGAMLALTNGWQAFQTAPVDCLSRHRHLAL